LPRQFAIVELSGVAAGVQPSGSISIDGVAIVLETWYVDVEENIDRSS
jgi:hypothetical protein